MHLSTHVPSTHPHHTYAHLTINCLLAQLSAHVVTHPFTYSPIYPHHNHHPIWSSTTYPPTHPAFTCPFTHLTNLSTHTTIHPPTLLYIHILIHPPFHSFTILSTPILLLPTHLHIYPTIYLHTMLTPLHILPPSIYSPIHLLTQHHPCMQLS